MRPFSSNKLTLILILLTNLIVYRAYCSHHRREYQNSQHNLNNQHHHHQHHLHHHHSHNGAHKLSPISDHFKRQTDTNQIYEANSYKKTVKVSREGEEPVETNYISSSSSGTPPQGSTFGGPPSDPNLQVLHEARRKVITTTIEEDQVVNNKGSKPSPASPSSSPPPPPGGFESGAGGAIGPIPDFKVPEVPSLPEPATNDVLSALEVYNITITQTLGPRLAVNFDDAKLTCPANQFGNVAVGCSKCNCNDNIDVTDSNNCDSFTGKCLKCLYNTEGDHCEICKPGFFGDATQKQCRECVCNKLGTDPNGGHCNQSTGQCVCKPHVEGLDCGKCKAGFFSFGSGKGCEACKCDPVGSVSQVCNEFDGKCECHSGYGGLKCNECPTGFYGDPKTHCNSCNCNQSGSLGESCDSKSGQCRCRDRFGGQRCDKCARGFHGRFPDCDVCGECFDQWNVIVLQLKNETQALLDKVKLLLLIGTPGSYGRDFDEIDRMLKRIDEILNNQKLDREAIMDLNRQIEELAKLLKELEKKIDDSEKSADKTVNRTKVVQQGLLDLNVQFDRITLLIEGLRENATLIQAYDVDGAYKIILDSQNRSREAEKRVRNLKPLQLEQSNKRRLTDSLSNPARYNSSSLQNEAILASLERLIAELERQVPGVNQQVCASQSTVNSCDQLCGGALCGKCGGLSCSEGATTKASNALDLAKQALDLINKKYDQARLDLEALLAARNMSQEALRQAKLVLVDCEEQKSKFDRIGNELGDIMDSVNKFFLMEGARPAEVRTLGGECLALSISLRPEQILDLARKIKETISSLTNIDKILQATANDLETAAQLHQQADRAKEAADNILDTVEQVLAMLRAAAIEQARAAAAIAAATNDIEGAQADLAEINAETERLLTVFAELTDAIKKLRDRLNELAKKYAQNELYVSQANATALEAKRLTDEAERYTNELADKVALGEEKLRNKARLNGELKDRAERLKNAAHQLAADILAKMNQLRELDDYFDDSVKRIEDYQRTVDELNRRMNEYIKDIDLRAQYYRECQT